MTTQESVPPLDIIERVAEKLDADVFLFSGPIDRQNAEVFATQVAQAHGRENCILILTTYGGDPDGAYLIARSLKRQYKRFTLAVFSHCKSAGTLIALGADEIIMSRRGELGPLDVQLFKDDEMVQSSGIDMFKALNVVQQQAFKFFEDNFLSLKRKSMNTITTKTAADIATQLAAQLLTPITAQVDPLRLGETMRMVNIAMSYGERLGASPDTLQKLIWNYPSHSFVIDLEEATDLFPSVREPDAHEMALEQLLRFATKKEHGVDLVGDPHDEGLCGCLTPRKTTETQSVDSLSDAQPCDDEGSPRDGRDPSGTAKSSAHAGPADQPPHATSTGSDGKTSKPADENPTADSLPQVA